MAIYGGTSGTLSGNQHGDNQLLTGDLVYGDAYQIQDHAKGGDDSITGIVGDSNRINFLYGDAYYMYDHAEGGDDTLTGGNSANENLLFGDAYEMHDKTKGGNDILTGGDACGFNVLRGDASKFRPPDIA